MRAVVGQMPVLPTLPEVYFRVLQEMESPVASVEQVGQLVARDPSMTAKLLQLVNSAFFGMSRRITRATEAVQFLGFGTVRSLALSIHTFSCFEQVKVAGFSYAKLWKHSLRTAMLAQRIMEVEGADQTMVDDAFVAGLLHDIGKLMTAFNLGNVYAQSRALAQEKQVPFWQAERELLETTHADIGAYLLGLWGLPFSIVEAVALHHAPRTSACQGVSPLTAVHVANVLEHEMEKTAEGGVRYGIDEGYIGKLLLTERLAAWRAACAAMRETKACH